MQPKLASDKLFEKIIASAYVPVSEFELAAFTKEAKQLLKIEPFMGYTILGAISSLKNSLESVHSNHQKAIRLHPEIADGHMNYGISLEKVGQFNDAVSKMEVACQLSPLNIAYLKNLMSALVLAGKIDSACSLAKKIHQLQPNTQDGIVSSLLFIKEAMEEQHIPQDEMGRIVNFMSIIATQADTAFSTFRIEFGTDDFGKNFSIYYTVAASPHKVAEMNDALIDMMVEHRFSDAITLYFTALFVVDQGLEH